MSALALVVAACGGDDGNGGGGPPDNEDPVADFSFSCEALACTFTDESTDPNGNDDITGWSWDFGDDATSTEPSPAHSYAAASTYTVTLTVTDAAGATSSTSQDVTVTAPAENQPPVAAFTFSCLSLDCEFTNQSTDPNAGDALTYAWDFGDGATSTDEDPTHSYTVTVADTFTVSLTTTDAGGLDNTVTHDVIVAPPAVCEGGSCDLTLQADATVTVELTSVGCTAGGNTLRILAPVDTTLFTDGCNTTEGTTFTLEGPSGTVFTSGTTIVPEVISGSQDLAFAPTLRLQAGSTYPTWVLEFDDGEGCGDEGDPTCGGLEPDFDDLIITITATPQ